MELKTCSRRCIRLLDGVEPETYHFKYIEMNETVIDFEGWRLKAHYPCTLQQAWHSESRVMDKSLVYSGDASNPDQLDRARKGGRFIAL